MNDTNPERQTGGEVVAENSYKRIFSEIEQAAKESHLDPQAAYELYEAHLAAENLDPTIYLSMAITSGGFARNADLSIGDVVDKNSTFGTLARQALLRQHPELSERDIILPSDLGKVKGWSQADYLLFWFHTMTGLSTEQARSVSEAMSPSLSYPGLTDKTLGTENRWLDYQRFTDDYVHCLRDLKGAYGRKLQPNNVQAMIMILDGNMSLGGRAEAALCRAIGIPPQFQFLDIDTVNEVPDFKDSTKALQNMGAHALGLSLNPPEMQFLGVGAGSIDTDIAFNLGFRKTGLANALFAAQFYQDHPSARPLRHGGHLPIGSGEVVLADVSNEALWRSYYSK